MNDSTRTEIRLRAATLAIGQTLPLSICPFCNGGMSEEKSFSISRVEAGLLYHCYRATCANSGGFLAAEGAHLSQAVSPKKVFTPKVFKDRTQELSHAQVLFFQNKFGLTKEELEDNRIAYCPTRNSFVFPIHDIRGYNIGVVDRSYADRKPKSISHWEKDLPKLHFPYQKDRGDSIVLVEDTISAIKVCRYISAAALLGSHLSADVAEYLVSVGIKRVILALDPDAIKKALKIQKKYKALFPKGFEVKFLDKDPKDQTDAAIKAWAR